MSFVKDHLDLIAGKFEQLQEDGCSILEACDGLGTFSKDAWRKKIGFGGNTESILISLPPEVRWEYRFQVKEDSLESQTQQLLKKGIDWLNITDA